MRLTAPWLGLLLLIGGLCSASCAANRSASQRRSPSAVLTDSHEPAWVLHKSSATTDFLAPHLSSVIGVAPHQAAQNVEQKLPVAVRLFEGVGLVAGIANEQLARTTAANRARAEIARLLEAYTHDLWRAYVESPAFLQLPPNTQLRPEVYRDSLQQAVRTFATSILLDLPIVAYFQSSDNHQFFALARLELATLVNYLVSIPELPNNLGDFIRQNATHVHEELAQKERS